MEDGLFRRVAMASSRSLAGRIDKHGRTSMSIRGLPRDHGLCRFPWRRRERRDGAQRFSGTTICLVVAGEVQQS